MAPGGGLLNFFPRRGVFPRAVGRPDSTLVNTVAAAAGPGVVVPVQSVRKRLSGSWHSHTVPLPKGPNGPATPRLV